MLGTTDEVRTNVLLWTPVHRHTRVSRPAKTYIDQLWEDTGCSLEDLPRAMNDKDVYIYIYIYRERERERESKGIVLSVWLDNYDYDDDDDDI